MCMTTNNVALVIPALNEEDALRHLLAELPASYTQWIIVVDNNSTDATASVAQAAGAIVVTELVRGYGRACWRGFKTASELGASIVVFMDGDGSDDPADLPGMLAPIIEGRADLVMGLLVNKRSQPRCVMLEPGGNMSDTALVIMARYPELGKTKTRLAASIGAEETLHLYRAFLIALAQRFADWDCDLYWAYTPANVKFAEFLRGLVSLDASSWRNFPQHGA